MFVCTVCSVWVCACNVCVPASVCAVYCIQAAALVWECVFAAIILGVDDLWSMLWLPQGTYKTTEWPFIAFLLCLVLSFIHRSVSLHPLPHSLSLSTRLSPILVSISPSVQQTNNTCFTNALRFTNKHSVVFNYKTPLRKQMHFVLQIQKKHTYHTNKQHISNTSCLRNKGFSPKCPE